MQSVKPELILNNFSTRLGHTVGRMFASLFPQSPDFVGRRVATFHNQRDFVFFRHHRYIFEDDSKSETGDKKVRLQEIGPRFCMKLRSLQHGTFNNTSGEYEWIHKVFLNYIFGKLFRLIWIQVGEDSFCNQILLLIKILTKIVLFIDDISVT
jgi:hypothetical protein